MYKKIFLLLMTIVLTTKFGIATIHAEETNYLDNLKSFKDDYFASTKIFSESLWGVNIKNNQTTEKDAFVALEERLHFETIHYPDYLPLLSGISTEMKYSADVLADFYTENLTYQTRELNVFMRPNSFMDIKIGRQILTWGTGDYLFINDMFAKDYISFFIGRNDQYLKKPQDAIRATFFSKLINVDMVLLSRFTPNTTPNGTRLSFYDGFKGAITGIESQQVFDSPSSENFAENEEALRLYRKIGRYELAGYFFNGWYKNPRAYKNNIDTLYHPPVKVYGLSLRGPLLGGIAYTESGYLVSGDDKKGTDRMVENSMLKALVGYSYNFEKDLSLTFQYFCEKMKHYDNYLNSLMPADFVRDEFRQLLTLQVIKKAMNQTLTFNAFLFYSPTDKDIYLRPNIAYNATDRLTITLGANIFTGKNDYTEFGQHKDNSNIYLRLHYGF